MLKKNKKFKFGKLGKVLGAVCVFVMALSGCAGDKNAPENPSGPVTPPTISPNEIVDIIRIPTIQESINRIEKIYGGIDKAYISGSGIVRRAYYKNAPTKVNICFEPNITQKILLEDVIEEYNEIFKVINPNYQFVLNYSPTKKEIEDDIYAIDVYIKDGMENGTVGQTTSIYQEVDKGFAGLEIVNNKIEINKSYAFDGRGFANAFRHEFMHTFACGDAYLNENATNETIMQGASYDMVGLYNIDVAFLDAFYRSPDNKYSEEEINEFIRKYDEQDDKYGLNNTIFKVYRQKLKELDLSVLKADINESNYLPAHKNAVIAAIGDKLVLSPINNIFAFAELQHNILQSNYYSYFKTPFGVDDIYETECNNYDVEIFGDELWSSGSYDYIIYDENMINYSDIVRNKLYINVNGYILALNTRSSFYNMEHDRQLTFSELYKPTDKNIMEYKDIILSWHENENE